jgi:putative endonuclease
MISTAPPREVLILTLRRAKGPSRRARPPMLELHMGAYVYIVRCRDGSLYTGSTRSSLEDRINQHNAGSFGGYTATRRPVVLIYSDHFDRIVDAVSAERQIKGWSRAKKEALARGDFESIKHLSRRKSEFD